MPAPNENPDFRYSNDNRPVGAVPNEEQYNYPSQGRVEGLMGDPATNKGREGYYGNDNRTKVAGGEGYFPNDNRPDSDAVDAIKQPPNSNYGPS
jgi:hypothetical protein